MDNPQAFPSDELCYFIKENGSYEKDSKTHKGMTLRDYFAGQVIVGIGYNTYNAEDAKKAYKLADAMLKERSK